MIFILAAAGMFATLIVVGLLFNPIGKSDSSSIASSANSSSNGSNAATIKARVGEQVDIQYSSGVANMIQRLPRNNNVTIVMSSELQNTNFAGFKGEIRYEDELIKYVQKAKMQTITGNNFKTIEYKFLPDAGNQTLYTFKNVQFISNPNSNGDSRVIVSLVPLSTAKVGERYTVKMELETGELISYGIGEKTIEIVP
jgi:hypothetical protein